MQVGLVGHKSDSSRRAVQRSEGENFAQKHNIFYAETTVNDPESIRQLFNTLLTSILFGNLGVKDTHKK